jgi:hypothetical protein
LGELRDFQLVVALSPAVTKQLPAPSRKAAQLEWTLPDAPGPSGAGTDAVMPVYNFLSKQIASLVSTLAGEEQSSSPTKPL